MKRNAILFLVLAGGVWADSYPFTAKPLEHSRTVEVGEQSIVPVYVGYGQTTLIVLPKDETVMDTFGLDKGAFWAVDRTEAASRYLSIKPKQKGISGTLSIVSNHGNIYTFVLKEVGDTKQEYDVKLFVSADSQLQQKINKPPAYVLASEANQYKAEAQQAKSQIEEIKESDQKKMEQAEDSFRSTYPQTIRHDYTWDRSDGQKLGLQDVWHDSKFTFIRVDTAEAPAFFEIRDGKKNITNAPLDHGIYTITHIVNEGELVIGKRHVRFQRTGV